MIKQHREATQHSREEITEFLHATYCPECLAKSEHAVDADNEPVDTSGSCDGEARGVEPQTVYTATCRRCGFHASRVTVDATDEVVSSEQWRVLGEEATR